MDRTTHRLLFSSLALIPACAALWVALHQGEHVPSTLLTVACSLVALGAALTHPGQTSAVQAREMMPLRRVPRDLPSETQQRATIVRALAAEDSALSLHSSLSREQATAWILRRCLTAWAQRDPGALTSQQMATAFLLTRLLTSSPGEAGRLAQFFRRPDAVLGLRDEVDVMARERAEWDRNQRLYLATQWLWTRQRHEQRMPSLVDALQALGPSDIDLWHRVVLEHDPNNPAQREAALWCLRQRGCDKATVAAYLAQIALDGRLVAAALGHKTAYLDAIRSIIENWNAGHYRTKELALDPPNALVEAAPRVTREMERVSRLIGAQWPLPNGAFVRYDGRPARVRRAWDLDTGLLRSDPERSDYFDAPTNAASHPHLL
ncbi:hypothetical protein [Sagittula sp. S175]|uniref:hypothetical protein n=1 Tax=Sagittula sp. S175 TaxID=3415129 RepID=UPI003C7DB1B6